MKKIERPTAQSIIFMRCFGLRASSLIPHSTFVIQHSCARIFAGLMLALLLPSCSQADSPDEAAVRAHLTSYFSTWSAKDMDAYGKCFHEGARITFVQPGGQTSTETLTDFLHSQRMAHTMSASPMKEEPMEMKIIIGKGIAQAAVKWKLTKDASITTGADMFTLARTPAGWRIVALVWEQD